MNKIKNINNKIEELKMEIEELEEKRDLLNLYTSVLIIKTSTNLKELQIIQNKIKDIVSLDMNFQNLGIKVLAYTITNEHEGFYMQFDFYGESEDVAELEKFYKQEKNIIKFITIKN